MAEKGGGPRSIGKLLLTITVLVGAIVGFSALSQRPPPSEAPIASILIDGSSTVYPISEALAEAFMEENPKVIVSIGISGTGGGFKRFVVGETDINDASRDIEESEAKSAEKNGVKWIELPIAIDGLSVVVNKENDWVDYFKIEELSEIWRPHSKVQLWSDVRPEWPKVKIQLYGPGPDSGTFDYFTARVVGKEKASRTDYVASEDDNVLVAGVAGEKYSLAYFGYAYYVSAKDRIKAVAIDGGKGPVLPSEETVRTLKYPLTRPLFLYINLEKFLTKTELKEYIKFCLKNAPEIVPKVGYVPFSKEYYEEAWKRLSEGRYEGLLKLAIEGV